MKNFALRLGHLLDAATGTKEFSEFMVSMEDGITADYDADKIRDTCIALLETTKLDSDLTKSLNLEKLDQTTVDFLVSVASTVGRCDLEHMKECASHRYILQAAYGGLLAGLAGINIRAYKRKVDVHEQITQLLTNLFDLTVDEDEDVIFARVWSSLMLDQENMMSVARVLSEIDPEKRQAVLERTASLAFQSKEKPDPRKLRELAMRALMGM